jgi:hypothetical protein
VTGFQETIDSAKGNFLYAKSQLVRALNTTPDDRINWSPAPSARTPIEIAAHAAEGVKNIHGTLDGRTFAVPTPEEADRGFRAWEAQFKTREKVLDLLERNSEAFVGWLDGLTPERLETMVTMPFGMGQVPLSMAITFVARHTQYHVAQMDYVQTLYGDRDWHMGE